MVAQKDCRSCSIFNLPNAVPDFPYGHQSSRYLSLRRRGQSNLVLSTADSYKSSGKIPRAKSPPKKKEKETLKLNESPRRTTTAPWQTHINFRRRTCGEDRKKLLSPAGTEQKRRLTRWESSFFFFTIAFYLFHSLKNEIVVRINYRSNNETWEIISSYIIFHPP